MEDTKTITLKKSVEFNAETFHELHLREPVADEIDKFSKASEKDGAVSALLLLISLVTGIPKPAIGKIGARDMKAAERFLSSFLDEEDDSQPIGANS
jgi:hypothetical protein